MSTSKFSGSAKVLKELQGLAGFVSYETCFRQGSSMTTTSMENMMEAQYFGDPADNDSIGLADQLVKGLGLFAGIYNQELLQSSVTAGSSSDPSATWGGGEELMRSPTPTFSSSTSGLVLVVKPELHYLGEDKKILVAGTNGLKLSTMLASGLTDKAFHVHIKGRTLLTRSREILKNCKKALALVLRHNSPYKSYASTGLLPSGMCHDDYLLYIRQKMYLALLPPMSSSSNQNMAASLKFTHTILVNNSNSATCGYADAPRKNEDAAMMMPDNYLFPGYLVFAMMGPIVPHEMRRFQSHLIMTKPPKMEDNNKANIILHEGSKRKRSPGDKQRVEVKQESGSGTNSRRGSPSTKGNKNYTVSQQLQIAAMAQAKKVIEIRERTDLSDRIVAMHTNKVAGKKALLEELKFLITNSSSDDPDRAMYMKQLKMLHQDLAMALDELASTERTIIDTGMEQLNKQADTALAKTGAGVGGGSTTSPSSTGILLSAMDDIIIDDHGNGICSTSCKIFLGE